MKNLDNDDVYDVVIIGAGPAGLTAGIYCGRYMLKTLILEKAAVGGQITSTSEIENYPGSLTDSKESGITLTARMREQAERFGAEIVNGEVLRADFGYVPGEDIQDQVRANEVKTLELTDGRVLKAEAVIIAAGARCRPIGCINEERFAGSGISYCAVCDGNFFTDLEVYVVGGGESAIEEALYLAKIARKVTVIHRRDSLRASEYTVKKAMAEDKLCFIWDSVVEEAGGEDVLDTLKLRNVRTGEETIITADEEDGMIGLFGFTGMQPDTDIYVSSGLELADGYICAGEDTHTNIPGVFAAGDIRTKKLRQVVTACADGAAAAAAAHEYILSL